MTEYDETIPRVYPRESTLHAPAAKRRSEEEPRALPGPPRMKPPHNGVGPTLPGKHTQRGTRPSPPSGWSLWWPVAAGLLLAVFAPGLREMALLWDPWGMRFLFPYVLLPGQPELGLGDELTRTLPRLMLYLQFPIEGLLTKINLSRGVRLSGALSQLVFLHAIGALVLFLVSGTTPP